MIISVEHGGDNPIAQYFKEPLVLQTLTELVKSAQYVVTGSEQLCSYIKKFNKNVMYIKAAFSFYLLEGMTQKERREQNKNHYSGSLYRDTEFIQVVPALKNIAKDYSDKVEIHFHGFIPENSKYKKYFF